MKRMKRKKNEMSRRFDGDLYRVGRNYETIGIKMNLVVMQNPFEEAMNRKFKIYHGGWVGSLLPSPEGSMHSKYSKEVNSSNYTGIADDRIDDLIEDYNTNWEIKERIHILQELDILNLFRVNTFTISNSSVKL